MFKVVLESFILFLFLSLNSYFIYFVFFNDFSVCLSIFLSLHLSVYLYVCLSLSLSQTEKKYMVSCYLYFIATFVASMKQLLFFIGQD